MWRHACAALQWNYPFSHWKLRVIWYWGGLEIVFVSCNHILILEWCLWRWGLYCTSVFSSGLVGYSPTLYIHASHTPPPTPSRTLIQTCSHQPKAKATPCDIVAPLGGMLKTATFPSLRVVQPEMPVQSKRKAPMTLWVVSWYVIPINTHQIYCWVLVCPRIYMYHI